VLADREIIFEFIDAGPAIRVAAIDVATGEEVVIQSPKSAARSDMERVAAAKLARKLGLTGKRKRPDDPPSGRGIKV
jgi:hypothetical protein